MGKYSPVPKPRTGHRRVSGEGARAGEEPRIAGVNAPRTVPSAAGKQQPKKASETEKSQVPQGTPNPARKVVQEYLSEEEQARLLWLREQKPPHWG